MSPATIRKFERFRHESAHALGQAGFERQANGVFHCGPGHRCNRNWCSFCQWVRGVDRANRAKEVIAGLPADCKLYSFTVTPDRDVPVQSVREEGDGMMRSLSRSLARKRCVTGSILVFENCPSQAKGEALDLQHPHVHGLIRDQRRCPAD